MIPVFTGISYIISDSYEPEPEFQKANPFVVNRNRYSGSVPVSGRVIQFWPYPILRKSKFFAGYNVFIFLDISKKVKDEDQRCWVKSKIYVASQMVCLAL